MRRMVVALSSKKQIDSIWCWLAAVYLGGIVTANALAAKLLLIGGVHVTVGALAIPLVYLTTDMINELYGEKNTRRVIYMGFLANLVLVSISRLAIICPASPHGATQDNFVALFDVTPRIVLASMTAYLISSLLDARLFAIIRTWTNGKHFWLRKNASTIISQLVDSSLFATIAFFGVLDWRILPGMILGQYLVKIVAAPLGTPLSYLTIHLAGRKKQ